MKNQRLFIGICVGVSILCLLAASYFASHSNDKSDYIMPPPGLYSDVVIDTVVYDSHDNERLITIDSDMYQGINPANLNHSQIVKPIEK